MLDRQDLLAIKELIDTSVTASEERLKSYVDGSIEAAVTASEERLKSYVDGSIEAAVTASEERLKAYVDGSIEAAVTASEERMKTYVNDRVGEAEQRWTVLYEGEIRPSIQLLAEGHQNLLDTLAPVSRVDKLEDEIVFIKSVLKSMNEEIAQLKKAQ